MKPNGELTTIEEIQKFIDDESYNLELYLGLELFSEQGNIMIALPEYIRDRVLIYGESLKMPIDAKSMHYYRFKHTSLIHKLNEVWVYSQQNNEKKKYIFIRIAKFDLE